MKGPTRVPGPVCERCHKPLVSASCGGCGGKGYYRKLLVSKNQCQMCHGSGTRLRCPDEFRHVCEDFRIPGKLKESPAYRSFRGGLAYKVPASVRPAAPSPPPGFTIPPPWHPSYPFPWHPAHPRSLNNPANPASPLHPSHRAPFGRR